MIAAVILLIHEFRLPRSYYLAQHPQREAAAYRRLGIVIFRNFIRRGPLHIFATHMEISSRAHSLGLLISDTERAETVHVLSVFVTVPVAAIAMIMGKALGGAFTLLFSLPLHGYPIMLQRYNRIRLQQALTHKKSIPGASG